MAVWVRGQGAGWRLEGSWPDMAAANLFLEHLRVRSFAPATVRAYAYDVLCFARFCLERGLRLAEVVPADVFDWVAWQAQGRRPASGNVVRLTRFAGAAPSVNRRVAAVRALFEHQVVLGARAENPVPAPRRGQGLRAKSRGVLGHLGPGRRRGGGRLVRAPQRLPEALEPGEVAAFLADLSTHRDRAITLAMLLGGLRAGEVRSLRLADVDQGGQTLPPDEDLPTRFSEEPYFRCQLDRAGCEDLVGAPNLPQPCDDQAGGRGQGLPRHNPGLVACVRPVGRSCGHHWPSTGRATVT